MDLKLGDPVFLRVLKEEQVLEVWMQPAGKRDFVHYKTYVLCRPAGELGPRTRSQDSQLPEGFYEIKLDSLHPFHWHHLAFEIDYPNAVDRYQKRPAAKVLVQGDCVGMGALALSNPNMEEVFTLVSSALHSGQESLQVHLLPFQLTDKKMNQIQANESPWLDFWANLKEGYDYFEIVRRPPGVVSKRGRYGFE
jgi:murein L,D-transpeptidase YafK